MTDTAELESALADAQNGLIWSAAVVVPEPAVIGTPIPREIAVRILADPVRPGVLNVYTPDEADALSVAEEALGGEPVRSDRSDVGIDLPCYGRRRTGCPVVLFGTLERGLSSSVHIPRRRFPLHDAPDGR